MFTSTINIHRWDKCSSARRRRDTDVWDTDFRDTDIFATLAFATRAFGTRPFGTPVFAICVFGTLASGTHYGDKNLKIYISPSDEPAKKDNVKGFKATPPAEDKSPPTKLRTGLLLALNTARTAYSRNGLGLKRFRHIPLKPDSCDLSVDKWAAKSGAHARFSRWGISFRGRWRYMVCERHRPNSFRCSPLRNSRWCQRPTALEQPF